MSRTRTENLALTMIVRDGVSAIWELHLAAANAYNKGYKAAAAAIIEIADAAEREWLRGTVTPDLMAPHYQSAAERWVGNRTLVH
ncbi:MAG: hypothetical protein JO213_11705 [Alphaproteobacteria bacterium]|nr:hypothetical protein [Alphaproteobacteria bacterium]